MSGLAIETLVRAMQVGGEAVVAAAIFWMRTQMGWSEKMVVDDGCANQPRRVTVELVDESPMSVESAERQRSMTGNSDTYRLAA